MEMGSPLTGGFSTRLQRLPMKAKPIPLASGIFTMTHEWQLLSKRDRSILGSQYELHIFSVFYF
jgi:hypothetical protein